MHSLRPTPARLALAASTAMVLLGSTQAGFAACDLTPTAGNSSYVCDSGTSIGLTDLTGNNTLVLPASGDGTNIITGNVVFGNGVDRVEIHTGQITGQVDQGDGRDVFIMTGGLARSLREGGWIRRRSAADASSASSSPATSSP